MKCPSCNREAVSGQKFCIGCGEKIPSSCPECGNVISNPEQKFCNSCGAQLASLTDAPHSQPIRETGYHHSSQPVKGAGGDLPLCPTCRRYKLTWEKEPIPLWVWVLIVLGLLTFYVFIGFVLWAIGFYWLIKGRKLFPYCPVCKKFFSIDSI